MTSRASRADAARPGLSAASPPRSGLRIIRPLALALGLLLAALVPACGAGGSEDEAGGGGGGGGGPCGLSMSAGEWDLAVEVLDLVNAERSAAGLDPLAWDDCVAEVAHQHSRDMDLRSFWGHVNPDGDGPGDRLDAAGIGWMALGENIARGQPTALDVMASWMGSPGHRANILSAAFTRLGVGVHVAPGGPWWTQVFLRP